jgi:iron complex outermembrane receptor protein
MTGGWAAPALIAAFLPGPALGQERPDQEAPPSRAAGTEEGKDDNIILVTARKREEPLQEVPISMTVLDAGDLAEKGINNFRELEHSVPNLMISGVDTSYNPEVSLRGISSDARNIGFESGLSMYVDGAYTGRPSSFNVDTLDIERIEVLRGPQGTLFGKNTTAGAINIVTRRPAFEPEVSAEIQYGNFDAWRFRGSVSGPIGGDKFAGRVGFFRRKRDGFQHNRFDGKDLYNDDAWGGRAELLVRPADDFDLLLSADYLGENYRPNVNELIAGSFGATGTPRVVDINAPVFQDRDVYGLAATATFDLGPASLTSITAFRGARAEFLSDDDASPQPFLTSNFEDDQDQFSQELRLASDGRARLEYVFGLFYYQQDVDTRRLTPLTNLLPFPITVSLNGSVDTESYAAFGQLEYEAFPRFIVTAGARYTYERKILDMALNGSPIFGIATLAIQGQKHVDKDFSPTFGVAYRVSRPLNLYAKVAKGFKAGGFNADYVPNAQVEFDPETVVNYEAGAKWVGPGGKIRANLAIFHMDYNDLQVITFSQFSGFVISNAAQARIRGAELDASVGPFAGFSLDGGLGYLDAKFTSFKNAGGAGVDFDGNALANAPRWTGNVGAQYAHRFGKGSRLFVRGDYAFRAGYFYDPDNERRIRGYGLLGGRLGVELGDGRLILELWAKNLTGKLYVNALGTPVLGSILGQSGINYGAPRTYGVRLATRF